MTASDRDFLIVIHSIFSSAMHDFRDNEVLLLTGHDVIVISARGAFHTGFFDNLKERPRFHNDG